MQVFIRSLLLLLVLLVLIVAAGVWALREYEFTAKGEASSVERFIARRLRLLAIPEDAADEKNPVRRTPEALAEAKEHFADHCAICHGYDGSGRTQIGQNLYPAVPDLREERTQSLSDGEIFYIIHNGVRFTGMPAWGEGAPEEDEHSWQLVLLIRQLPEMTQAEIDEMKQLGTDGEHGETGAGTNTHGGGHTHDDGHAH